MPEINLDSRLAINNVFKALYLRRYKRFFVDVQLDTGEIMTVHCPNTGSMQSILETAKYAWCSSSSNPKRKLKASLEVLELENGTLVLVNTQRPNQIVKAMWESGALRKKLPHRSLKAEAKYGDKSRIDFLLDQDLASETYLEVKNVTLAINESGLVSFPDAVSQRGQKHLRELIEIVEQGKRGVMLYLISRTDARFFEMCEGIDLEYKRLFDRAIQQGVECLPIKIGIRVDAASLIFEWENINLLPAPLKIL